MKNGFGGIFFAVEDHLIVLYAPGLPLRLARRLGIDLELRAEQVSLTNARVGWLGSRLFAQECVVLTWERSAGVVQLAINPADRDLKRLQSALLHAGAHMSVAAGSGLT